IGKCERRHDREPHVTNFAETRAQLNDAPIEIFREVRDTRLFAVLTCHPKLAAVDGDADLRHGTLRAGSPRARIGSCRWRRRAAERLHDSRFPACGCARSRHQAPPQAASGRRQARAVARQEPAFFDSPGPRARASPSNTVGSAMTSPKSLFAAAASPAAQTMAVRRDDHAVAPRARHDRMANALRALAMDAVEQAKSGHP